MRHLFSRLCMVLAIVVSLLIVQAGAALATAPTAAPTILGPANGSSVGSVNPTLSWSPVSSAVRYNVQISTSALFSTTIYSVDTYALQATPPMLLPFQTLYWRVAGEDGGNVLGPYSAASFTKSVASAPAALTPTDKQVLTFPTDHLVFSWQPVAGAVSYTLQIGNSNDFIGAAQYTTVNTSYTLTDTQSFTLSDGVTLESWWWQVQAVYSNSSVTAWSTPRSYQMNWPATPQLKTPANGATGVVDTVFSWDPIPGAASYWIQVSPNGDWGNTVIDQPLVLSTRYAPDMSLLNSSYFWRVRARAAGSATNYGPWSDASSDPFFFTRSWSPRPVTISPHWTGGLADPPIVGNLEFSWTPASSSGAGWVDHASHYELQIGTDVNFSNGTYTSCMTDQTTFTPYAPVISGNEPGGCGVGFTLGAGGIYYWRVRGIDAPAGNGGVLGLWDSTSSADTQRFIYIPTVPSIVSTSPCVATGTHVKTPVLCWTAVSGAETYVVTILKHDGTQADQIETRALSWTPLATLLPADGPFTWNVETKDAQGNLGLIRASWPSFYLDALTPSDTDLSLTPLTPSDGASSIRMPSLTWKPYTGAAYYEVLYGVTPTLGVATPLSGSNHLPFAGFTLSGLPLSTAHYYWAVEAFDLNGYWLSTGPTSSFYVGITPTYGSWIIPWSDYLTPECKTRQSPVISRCTPTLGQTQEMTWNADPNAGAYYVYVAKDPNFTTIYREYETEQTSLTPRESWLDSQAGESYYWFVRPCIDWSATHCGPGQDTNAGLDNSSTYKKSSPPQNGLATTTSANPPVAASTIPYQVTFNWADYMTTSQASAFPVMTPTPGVNSTRVTQEAKQYKIEVSTTADFGNIIDTRYVDQVQYTPWSMTYPEGPLFWRVQGLDGSGNTLTLSATGTVTKASPAITLTAPASAGTVTGVPSFTWVPQNWAASYTIEIYRNGDLNFSNVNLLFSQTTPIAAWSPTQTMPAGTYAWRVRRLDAYNRPGPWSVGRTFTLHALAPTLNTPADLAHFDGSNLPFTWLATLGAVSYQFQSSIVSDFSTLHENQTTVMTAWSPVALYSAGVYYWRVNLLDASGNVLSTSNSRSFTAGAGPGAPTGAVATAGNTTAGVSWTAPASTGSGPITGYIVTSKPGAKTCTSTTTTSCTVSGLTNGTSYTFSVQAITIYGTGPASTASNMVVPSSISVLAVSAGVSQTSSVAFNVTVTARDGVGVTQNGYRGKVHFTSSDLAAVLPADYTFTVSDAGTHVFSVILKTAATQSVTATDTVTASLHGSQTGIVVAAGALSKFVVSGMTTPRIAGSTGNIRVTATDTSGNRIQSYRGTIHLTSSDAQAKLPANYTFTVADAGTHVFSGTLTLKTAGTQSVTATDTVTATIKGSQTGIVVTPAALSKLVVSGLGSPRPAGIAGSLRVTATDAYGNRIVGYLGTIHLTSTDTAAKLPANYTFVVADAGTHVFSANVTLKTKGTWSITATDTVTATLKGSQIGIVVN
jgi:hypothetical protein